MNTDINNLNRSNPFKAPEGYFSDLEKNILQKTTGENQNQNPFKTPEAYFDQLENSIMSRIENKEKEENKNGKVISLFSKKLYWMSTAACILFMATLGFFILNKNYESAQLAVTEKENAISIIDELYIADSLQDDSPVIARQEVSVPNTRNLYISGSQTKNKKSEKIQSAPVSQTKTVTPLQEKTSEIIYSLYFDDTTDEDYSSIEEEFFLTI